VDLSPYLFDGQDDDVCDKVGQAIGKLQALKTLYISTRSRANSDGHDDDRLLPTPFKEILARILRHVRQSVAVIIGEEGSDLWTVGEVQALARAIRGHPSITGLHDLGRFPYESLDTLFSALTTLPALESITLGAPVVRQVDESSLAHPESLTELLRVPSLQSVSFRYFDFTSALCQAAANAFMEGTAITKLEFRECNFFAEESIAILANGLSSNTSVVSIKVQYTNSRALFDALAAVLPSNSTLQHLELCLQDNYDPDYLSPIISAMGNNTGLKTLEVHGNGWIDESLSTAIKDGLGMNETLESLELNSVHLTDDNSALWCRAFSFLRVNKALKSLLIDLEDGVTESCLSAFRIGIAAMLQDNVSLESLSIRNSVYTVNIPKAEYIALLPALQYNTALKTFCVYRNGSLRLTDDEDKHIAALLKKNYALESLPNIDLDNKVGDVGAILRLNGAGRRYLIEDGSSISKGVEVLSAVSEEINCVFLHLLENPILCDRSAVEATSDSTDNRRVQ
jgi:hypothetical protein